MPHSLSIHNPDAINTSAITPRRFTLRHGAISAAALLTFACMRPMPKLSPPPDTRFAYDFRSIPLDVSNLPPGVALSFVFDIYDPLAEPEWTPDDDARISSSLQMTELQSGEQASLTVTSEPRSADFKNRTVTIATPALSSGSWQLAFNPNSSRPATPQDTEFPNAASFAQYTLFSQNSRLSTFYRTIGSCPHPYAIQPRYTDSSFLSSLDLRSSEAIEDGKLNVTLESTNRECTAPTTLTLPLRRMPDDTLTAEFPPAVSGCDATVSLGMVSDATPIAGSFYKDRTCGAAPIRLPTLQTHSYAERDKYSEHLIPVE